MFTAFIIVSVLVIVIAVIVIAAKFVEFRASMSATINAQKERISQLHADLREMESAKFDNMMMLKERIYELAGEVEEKNAAIKNIGELCQMYQDNALKAGLNDEPKCEPVAEVSNVVSCMNEEEEIDWNELDAATSTLPVVSMPEPVAEAATVEEKPVVKAEPKQTKKNTNTAPKKADVKNEDKKERKSGKPQLGDTRVRNYKGRELHQVWAIKEDGTEGWRMQSAVSKTAASPKSTKPATKKAEPKEEPKPVETPAAPAKGTFQMQNEALKAIKAAEKIGALTTISIKYAPVMEWANVKKAFNKKAEELNACNKPADEPKTSAQQMNDKIKKAKEAAKNEYALTEQDRYYMTNQVEAIGKTMMNTNMKRVEFDAIKVGFEGHWYEYTAIELTNDDNLTIVVKGKKNPYILKDLVNRNNQDNRLINLAVLKSIHKIVNEAAGKKNKNAKRA